MKQEIEVTIMGNIERFPQEIHLLTTDGINVMLSKIIMQIQSSVHLII